MPGYPSPALPWLALLLGLHCGGAPAWTRPGPARPEVPGYLPAARATTDATAQATVVYLAPMDREREARDLAQAVRSQLSDLRARLRLAWAAPTSDTLDAWLQEARRAGQDASATAVFWTSRQRLHLAFVERQELRLLIRGLGGTQGAERAEAVALILRAALAAYRRGARFPATHALFARATPPPPRPPPPRTSPPSDRRRAPRLALELGYAFETWSRVVPAHHGVSAAVTWRLHRLVSLRLGTRWTSPIVLPSLAAEDPVRARLTRYPVFGAARLEARWRRLTLGAEAALQVEYLRMRIGPAAIVRQGADRGDVRWALEPAFFMAVSVVDRLRLHLRLAAELILRFQEFGYIDAAGDFVSCGREWPVKPRAEVGLTVDLW